MESMTRRVMNMNVKEWGRPYKRWINCVRQEYKIDVSEEMPIPKKLVQR
jgi:hypothetical protein